MPVNLDRVKQGQDKRAKKGWAIALGVLVGLFAIAVVAYVLDIFANQGKIPRGVSVGGVDISQMERGAAVKKLQQELGDVEQRPVVITAGEQRAELIPAESGIKLDFQAAVEGI